MLTTNRSISLDAVGREGEDLIHLTGSVQMVARATTDGPSGSPVQVELRFDAARVRGVGLRTGARYWVEGIHQSRRQLGELSPSFTLVSRFEVLGCALDGSPLTHLTLTVRFKVTIPTNGRVTVAAEAVKLLPDSS